MAAPFKRLCLRSARPVVPSTQLLRAHPIRALTTTSSLHASPEATPSNHPSDAELDALTTQPGVTYTTTTSPDTLPSSSNPSALSSAARRNLDQHRELREITRIAAWQLPLLSPLAKPYTPAPADHILRWRYTTYMGEPHPASRKVVVEFAPGKIESLTKLQQKKLAKLAGPRYDFGRKVVRMSCESFETPAQNKRALGDMVQALVAECADPEADTFGDVPLDRRAHRARRAKTKVRAKFPDEWRLTAERRGELEEKRRVGLLAEGERVEGGKVVNGVAAIEEARNVDVGRVEEPVMAEARQPLPVGKMGKKEMGQQKVQRP